jgi:hypothetical protein
LYAQKNYLDTVVENTKSNLPYTVGVTQFSDLTREEFKSNYLGQLPFQYLPLLVVSSFLWVKSRGASPSSQT